MVKGRKSHFNHLSKMNEPMGDVFKCLSLVLFQDRNNSDIYDIYKLLGINNLLKLTHFYHGRTFKLPEVDELKDAIKLSLCFYYRKVENLRWDEIITRMPMKISSIKMENRIKRLDENLKNEMLEIFGKKKEAKE